MPLPHNYNNRDYLQIGKETPRGSSAQDYLIAEAAYRKALQRRQQKFIKDLINMDIIDQAFREIFPERLIP